jgi:predicted nucleotidyltransferase
MLSGKDIIEILNNKKEILFSKYSIQSMALFGSYARDENSSDSDVDIMVEFKDAIGFKFTDLADELEKTLNLKVDLVSKNGIKAKYFEYLKQDLKYV